MNDKLGRLQAYLKDPFRNSTLETEENHENPQDSQVS
jgi:hypothetical protein